MLIVAGLSLKNLQPRIWDPASPDHLPALRAVMVSYADFCQLPARRRAAMAQGLRGYLGVPDGVAIYLDNGAFSFLARDGDHAGDDYEAFVAAAKPDRYPIPRDVIPSPRMTLVEQRDCLSRTMRVNLAYQHDGYVPVVHISQVIDEYIVALRADPCLSAKPAVALGGIVPNLLRMPKARPYREILDGVQRVRDALAAKEIHLFGVGGTATLHLAALLGMDSVDSSGWRNRAARGLVQLPGSGDRLVAKLGSWRGREPSPREWQILERCPCPACTRSGRDGLTAAGTHGFCHRATHNLWVLLADARMIEGHLTAGTYAIWYTGHLDNSIYRPLIDHVLERRTVY